jgi:lipopolysaccharide transport system ATP-binding protein
MGDTVIRVENLCKSYVISHQEQQRYSTLRDTIASGAKSIGRKFAGNNQGSSNLTKEEFWALKDVAFDIKQGDRVGIIGRNGAGKSTLLKILSRITEPTKGSISIKGRVASLLEVGTGFHPELTGRENIYLNGAILGMSKTEIKRKFDEIVDFAEVEKFLDTPVKRYSSGMYVRLAFAVAAHLEPEILIVDEVLAVGDTQFQKKCLGKMEDVSREGRTIIFVSHNMGTVTQLCAQAIYLIQGKVDIFSSVKEVVSKYLAANTGNNAFRSLNKDKNKPISFREISIINFEGEISSEIDVRHAFYISLKYEVIRPVRNVELSIDLFTADGRPVFTTNESDYNNQKLENRKIGFYEVAIEMPGMFLMPGSYLITIGAHEPGVQNYDVYENVLRFNINETGTKLSKYQNQGLGIVVADFPWIENHSILISRP